MTVALRAAGGVLVFVGSHLAATHAEKPLTLFSRRYVGAGTAGWNYDVSPNGRFLVIKDEEASRTSTNLVVVWNWIDELRRLIPAE